MFWADRINKVAGVTLLLLALGIILNIVFTVAAVGDSDPIERGEIEEVLRDINDNEALFFLAMGFSIATDVAISLAAGAGLYLLLRDRSRLLALFGFVGLVAGGIAFMAGDAGALTLGVLAQDFVEEGGPGGIAAGDPVILQSARAVGAFAGFTVQIAFTAIAFGLLAFGALITWAKEGTVNPPRWLGALAILSALAILLSWLAAVDNDLGDVFFLISNIGVLLFLIILGGWLLMQPEDGEASPAPSPAPVGGGTPLQP
jgi:hypothetical protein